MQQDSSARYGPMRSLMDISSPSFDPEAALREADRGAEAGDADALYIRGLFRLTGRAGQKDAASGTEDITMAGSSGSREAIIVSAELARNPEDAEADLLALRLRGEMRDTGACQELFAIYDKGNALAKKDHHEAVRFLTVCAEAGDAEAQCTVGNLTAS